MLSEVSASRKALDKLSLPVQSTPEIAAVLEGWPNWKREGVTICPVGDNGRICDGLRYTCEFGLVFSSI